MRMRHAVVAVVASVTAAHGGPLFRADRGLLLAFARARDLAAILGFGVLAEETGLARGRGSTGTAAPHRTSRDAGCNRLRALPGGSRRHAMRVGHADVEVGTPVAPADRAVVFGARRGHREAGALRAGFTTVRGRSVVTHESRVTRGPGDTAALPTGPIRVARRFTVFRARTQQTQTENPHSKSRHALVGIPQA